jgi:ParB family chromosome partitioning protein
MSPRENGPRLGRGLAALLGDAAGAAGHGDSEGVRLLPIASLEPGPYQPRQPMQAESLRDLTDSIRARGILQPLLARPHPDRPGQYQIIAGERRWRAAQSAGLHEVPALVRPLADAEAMAAALVENLQRLDLNPIEEAEGYRRLTSEFAMTQEALGEAVGKSRSHIANTLRLLNLPPRVQAEVRHGALTAGHARALLAHPEPEKAALAVIARGLNVRQTEALASRRGDPDAPDAARGPPRRKPAETVALEHMLSGRLGLKVDVTFDGSAGTLRIHFRTLDQLDGLVALLTRD